MIIRTFLIISYLLLATSLQANTKLPSGLSANEWQNIQAQMASNHKNEINITQEAYIKASNADAEERFGISLALDGNTLAVGAPNEDSAATGINGDQLNNDLEDSGAVYIFVKDDSDIWSQQAYIKASDPCKECLFGIAIALEGDSLVVTTNPFDHPGVYVFVRDENSVWSQQTHIKKPVSDNEEEGYADGFGRSVAIDNNTLVVGANDDGGVPGDEVDPVNDLAGAVFVYIRDGNTWSEPTYITASNRGFFNWFGWSVALDGDILVVGAPYEKGTTPGVNNNDGEPKEVENFQQSGAVYVFIRKDDGWIQTAYIKASNLEDVAKFGYSVALDNDTLAVGSYGNYDILDGDLLFDIGATYVFVQDNNGDWSQQAYIEATFREKLDWFGYSVALDNDILIIGAAGEDSSAEGINGDESNNNLPNSGAAYIFKRDADNTWSQQFYIKVSNPDEADNFGYSVALSGNNLLIASPWEDSASMGINGDQSDNSAENAGAVYAFNLATNNQPIEDITPKQGLYWNPNASGHGYQLAMVDSGEEEVLVVFVYTYDEANDNETQGAPTWYLSDGAKIDGNQWEAPLRRYHRNEEGEISNEIVGNLRIDFNDDTSGTISWELADIGLNNGSEPIERFVFGAEVTDLTGAYADLDELGYGITVDAQAPASGMVLYYYDESGHGRWVLGVDDDESGNYEMLSYQGYCLSCPMTEITSEVVGEVVVNDVSNNTLGLDIDITYPGGDWMRSDITMTRLTLPVD